MFLTSQEIFSTIDRMRNDHLKRVTFDATVEGIRLLDGLSKARGGGHAHGRSALLRDLVELAEGGPACLDSTLERAHRRLLLRGREPARGDKAALDGLEDAARRVSPALHARLEAGRRRGSW